MMIVTGGAGFIGSNLQAALAAQGHETVVVDRLGLDGKWRNLGKHPPARLLLPDALEAFLAVLDRVTLADLVRPKQRLANLLKIAPAA